MSTHEPSCSALAAAAERLVGAVAREQAARRGGHWTQQHETATSLASMALELELIRAKAAS